MTTGSNAGALGSNECAAGRPVPERCAVLLATLLQYAKYPATQTQPGGFHLFCRTTF